MRVLTVRVHPCRVLAGERSDTATSKEAGIGNTCESEDGARVRLHEVERGHGPADFINATGGDKECSFLILAQAGGLLCHNFPVCGRYRLSRRKQIIEEHFDSVSDVSE